MKIPNILSLDSSGNPRRWVGYEQAAFYQSKGLILWSLGDNYTLHGGIQRLTGIQSTMDIQPIIAIKGKVNPKTLKNATPKLNNKILFRRDMNICAYCGDYFPATKLTRDHVVPKYHNGPDCWENVVAACSNCNKRKGGRTPEQANMPLLYVPYKPCIREQLILHNKQIISYQMEFLLSNIKNPKSRIFSLQ